MESIAELRRICQGVHSEDLSARIVRRVSIYVTWLCLRLGLTANQISVTNLIFGLLATGSLFISGPWGLGLCLAFFSFNSVLDGVDGEIARYRRQSSLNGLFLDRINSLFVYPGLFVGLAYRAASGELLAEPARGAGLAAAIAVIGIRYVRALADVTVVDGLTQAKATREVKGIAAEQASLSAGVRQQGRIRWLLDFFTLRQPGFNIALAIVLLGHIMVEIGLGPSWLGWLLPIWLGGSAVVYVAGTVMAARMILRSNYIDGMVDRVRGQG